MDTQFQLEIERLFNKNQLMPRLKSEFKAANGFEKQMTDNGILLDFGYTLLAQICLHKRANMQTMVGILRHFFVKEHGQKAAQKCADMLLKAAEHDLVDWHPVRREFIMKWDVSSDVKIDLERYQYPLPMVIEPKEVASNMDTGYLTIRNSMILKDNHHEDDICLDHINSMNRIKLRVNHDVARMIKNKWKGLDKAKPDETYEDYQKRVRAFEKYDRTARDVMQMIEVSGNGEFYLTHKYDKRGRCYSQGYHINYQGNPWNKAVIEFGRSETVDGFN